MVVDQEGEWLSGWRKVREDYITYTSVHSALSHPPPSPQFYQAFDYFEIPTLRSPMLAHPDPRTELALLEACSECEGGLR